MYKFTKLLMRASSSFCASATASSVPITVISSWSLSSGVGKIILAPVLSRTFRMFPPPFPIRNLWYSGLARSSAVWLLVCYKLNIGQSVVLESCYKATKTFEKTPATNYLLLSQGQQLFFSLLYLLSWASDCHSINARALGGEMDVHSTALLHDGTHKAPFGTNQGVVQF